MPPTRNNNWIIPLLGSLCVVTPFAIDMYLPAFSKIAAQYGTTTARISLTLSTYFVGFALGQLIYGPLLDRYGRKRPLYVGLVVYILCSVGCSLAPDLRTFTTLRFLEALGGCVAQVAAMAMVRDFFPPRQVAKILSLCFLMIGVSPLLAPTIGSLVMTGLGWQWIFLLLATIAFVILMITIFWLPEGHQPDESVSLRLGPILANCLSILKNPQFLTYNLAGSFSFAGLFTYVAGSPIIFMDGFHMNTKSFGVVFAVLVMGFIGGNQVNVFLLRRFSSPQIFTAALMVQVFIAILFFVGTLSHLVDLKATLVLFFLFLSCIGLTFPNAAALSIMPFSRDIGQASALGGFLQTGTGAAISMSIGLFGPQAVVTLLASTTLISLTVFLVGRTRIGELIESKESQTVMMH
jgi:MFS transporter, DHA1 family, multidrug resistance protein